MAACGLRLCVTSSFTWTLARTHHRVRSLHGLLRTQLWRVGQEKDGSPTVEHCTNLTGGHTRTVNCVRFSPTGKRLPRIRP